MPLGQWLGPGRKMAQRPEPVMIGAGGTMLALFQAPPESASRPSEREQPPLRWRRVAWRTNLSGFEAAQEHLAALGIVFRGPVDHGGTWSIYFQDPDGNPLEITTPSVASAERWRPA
jgi:catechol-2,3-dioxygenase